MAPDVLTTNSAVIIGRKPEMPQAPDPYQDPAAKYHAPLTPTSLSAGPSEQLLQEPSHDGPPKVVLQPFSGSSSVEQGFTPFVDIPQAPANKQLQDPGFRFS